MTEQKAGRSHSKMPMLMLALVLALGIAVLIYYQFSLDKTGAYLESSGDASETLKSISANSQNTPALKPIEVDVRRVAKKVEEKREAQNPFRFDVEYIFNHLSLVRLDENGDVIVDGQAKKLLENAFSRMTYDLSEAEIAELQALITLGVRGEAGEKVAKIVTDYYQYRIAEQSFLEMTGVNELSDAESNLEQIIAIREAHLGYELAHALYGEEQRQTRYMLESMKIAADESLNEEQREAAQDQLQIKYEMN